MRRYSTTIAIATTFSFALVAAAQALRINEIADKGTSNVCNGEDWIELFLPLAANDAPSLNLAGYILHDDKGPGRDISSIS